MTKSSYYPTPPPPPAPTPDPGPDDDANLRVVLVGFIIGLIIFVLSCSLLASKPEPQTCEADYYRGVYSLCMVLNAEMSKNGSTNLVACDILVKEAIDLGWYERAAPGFEWPRESIPHLRGGEPFVRITVRDEDEVFPTDVGVDYGLLEKEIDRV